MQSGLTTCLACRKLYFYGSRQAIAHRECTPKWVMVSPIPASNSASNTPNVHLTSASNMVDTASNNLLPASNTARHDASNKQRWARDKYNEYMRSYMATRRAAKKKIS